MKKKSNMNINIKKMNQINQNNNFLKKECNNKYSLKKLKKMYKIKK